MDKTFEKEEKELGLSEDETRVTEDKIQKITDKFVESVSNIISEKEKEIMEI